jgi:lipopolysaccharide export LptBFGC system permease protein LptF
VRSSPRATRASSAVVVYVIILVAFQVFLLTVAVEAFATDDEPLAWATAAVSVTLAAGSALLLRYLRP